METKIIFRPRVGIFGCTNILALVTVVALLFCLTQTACGQGKLSRISKAVHKKKEPSQRKSKNGEPDRNQPQHDESDDHADDHRHPPQKNKRSNDRHRGNRAGGFSLDVHSCPPTSVTCYPEPVFIPVVSHPLAAPGRLALAAPVIIDRPIPVVGLAPAISPVFNPVVSDAGDYSYPANCDSELSMGMPHITECNIVETLGEDWFHHQTSRLWAVGGSDFDDTTAGGLGVRFQAPGSVGLDSSVMMLRETTDSYREHLWIGDVNALYEILARDNVRGRIGLGVNWLNDSIGSAAGLNLTAGMDLRLTDRLVLSGEGDFGTLGDADFLHTRVNLATRFDRCDWLIGADHYNIGGVTINNFFTGIQLRF